MKSEWNEVRETVLSLLKKSAHPKEFSESNLIDVRHTMILIQLIATFPEKEKELISLIGQLIGRIGPNVRCFTDGHVKEVLCFLDAHGSH